MPELFGGTLFETFPYLLPCAVVAALIVLSGAGLVWLPPRPSVPASGAVGRAPTKAAPVVTTTAAAAATATAAAAAAPAASTAPLELADEGDGRRLLAGSSSSSSSSSSTTTVAAAPPARPRLPSACASCLRPVSLLLLAYLLINFGMIGSMEALPLFLQRNDTSGLGLSPAEMGQALLPQAAVIMVSPQRHAQCTAPSASSPRRRGHAQCAAPGAFRAQCAEHHRSVPGPVPVPVHKWSISDTSKLR